MAAAIGKTTPLAGTTDPTNPPANGLDHQGIAIKKGHFKIGRPSLIPFLHHPVP
jgi:hypothetical protein